MFPGLAMNAWYQDFSKYPHNEGVNFEKNKQRKQTKKQNKKKHENSRGFAILRRRRFYDIGIYLIIRLKTH